MLNFAFRILLKFNATYLILAVYFINNDVLTWLESKAEFLDGAVLILIGLKIYLGW